MLCGAVPDAREKKERAALFFKEELQLPHVRDAARTMLSRVEVHQLATFPPTPAKFGRFLVRHPDSTIDQALRLRLTKGEVAARVAWRDGFDLGEPRRLNQVYVGSAIELAVGRWFVDSSWWAKNHAEVEQIRADLEIVRQVMES